MKRLVLATAALALASGCRPSSKTLLRSHSRAAIWLHVTSSDGSCVVPEGDYHFPADAGLRAALRCDRRYGCTPNAIVATDADEGTEIACGVTPRGDDFDLSATFNHPGGGSIVEGPVLEPDSMVTMSHYFADADATLSGDCILTVDSLQGDVAAGLIRAEFGCGDYPDWNYGTTCQISGNLLFEGCEK